MSNSSYFTLNLIFAGLILALFLFSIVYPLIDIQIPSGIKVLTGNETASTGLTRGFTEIFRLNFQKAQEYNSSSLRIFGFFLFQLFFRFALIPLSRRFNIRFILASDVILTILLFILAFYKILDGLYQVY